ncbi:DNA repair protein RecO [Candidatus Pacearchaeota archaeon]|nr:MAG: DNA repair protein RecO [Candidatus Pacearchaeota archaeon]
MIFSLEACILNKEKFGEIDYLVELLTKKGKIWAIAKGARKSKKRFVNTLEEFNFIIAHLRKPLKSNFLILESADLIFIPETVRNNYKKYLFISYIGEILSKISFSELRVEYFEFVKNFIKEIENVDFIPYLAKPFFEIQILSYLGYKPEFRKCIKCGYIPKRIIYLSIPAGGVVCFKCKNGEDIKVDKEVINILKKINKNFINFKFLKKIEKEINFNKELLNKIYEISENFLKFFLPFEINSLKFLKTKEF